MLFCALNELTAKNMIFYPVQNKVLTSFAEIQRCAINCVNLHYISCYIFTVAYELIEWETNAILF